MPRSIEAVLSSLGVTLHTGGKHELMTRCPLCGSADEGQHLAISTRGRGWRCLRNPRQHRGGSYAKLVQYLTGCTPERARELTGEKALAILPDKDEFALGWRRQLGVGEEPQKVTRLQFPREVKPLTWDAPRSDAFWNYLLDPLPKGRGFTEKQAIWAAKAYDLHYAMTGRYSYRLVIPVHSATGQLMTWTARSILPKADIRYMTLKSDEAVAPPGDLLLGLPMLYDPRIKARCLGICEGPFDAIATTVLGHDIGVYGTCLFGLELSSAQADLLSGLDERFDRMRLLLDSSAWPRILGMRSFLSRRCRSAALPPGFKDPGEFVGRKGGVEFIQTLAA